MTLDDQAFVSREAVRQLFDAAPYPRIPLEQSVKDSYNLLFFNNVITAHYLTYQKILKNPSDLVILDVGCGTGYTSLILAEANPGAKIIGVDISANSIHLAKERLQYYGFHTAEFYTMTLEEILNLGIQFDYINCDEVLYLLPDPLAGLQAMKSVLKPDGIIRANLHSAKQRILFFAGQELFLEMGLMAEDSVESEIKFVRETIAALKDEVTLKSVWKPHFNEDERPVIANFLLRGDKGFTILDLFALLKEADLQFISMVNWQEWDLLKLFQNVEDLPLSLMMRLSEMSEAEQLHTFELLHPIHRLLDFWCGYPSTRSENLPPSEWSLSDWQRANVYLHPQFGRAEIRDYIMECVRQQTLVEIQPPFKKLTFYSLQIESNLAACLLPLWSSPQSFISLVERWLKIRPVDPVTLEPMSETQAMNEIRDVLIELENFLYVLLEPNMTLYDQ